MRIETVIDGSCRKGTKNGDPFEVDGANKGRSNKRWKDEVKQDLNSRVLQLIITQDNTRWTFGAKTG